MAGCSPQQRLSNIKQHYDIVVVGGGIYGATMAWEIICDGHQKEFSSFNVNFVTDLNQHLTKIGKTEYIAAKEDQYELAEIKALNANSEIMEELRENLPGIYFSIRQLCSWHWLICREK